MKDPKVVWAWVGGAVVVIALAAGVAWHFYGGGGASNEAAAGPVAVHAPTGQLVPGFPQALILDDAAQVNNSYSINYSTSTNQYTAEWSSSSSLASLYAKYQNYAAVNGWTISNSADYPTLKGIYATNASATAAMNVIMTPQDKGSEITISYVAQ
jgi:hypothetical protein